MQIKFDISNDSLRSKLGLAIALMVLLIIFGCLGYYFYFDYSLVDAFYMTIITIATVGFREVNPLDDNGKLFTSALIILSLVVIAFSITTISTYLLSVDTILNIKSRKMQNKISKLQQHIIICGYGRNGRQAVIKLEQYGKQFVIIESNPEIIQLLEKEKRLFVMGNATDDSTLISAGIEVASYLISTLPSDSDNVFIALSAKQLNKNLTIISRSSSETNIKKLKISGVDNVIMPDKIGGDHMASLIVSPDLIEFLDNLSSVSNNFANIREISLFNMLHLSNLGALLIKERTGCTVIGYKSKNKEYVINPDPEFMLEPEGRIIVLGRTEQIKKLNNIFNLDKSNNV
ncbi:MAG: potassium channel protein [Saprospiraceae bacterium]|nr:potassium channel protein [Saprospiraceae bacterium]